MDDSATLFTHPVIVRGADVEDGVTKTPCLRDCGLVGALNDRSAGVVDNTDGHRGGCTLVREHAVVCIDLKLKNKEKMFYFTYSTEALRLLHFPPLLHKCWVFVQGHWNEIKNQK